MELSIVLFGESGMFKGSTGLPVWGSLPVLANVLLSAGIILRGLAIFIGALRQDTMDDMFKGIINIMVGIFVAVIIQFVIDKF
jgi:hypothetical protein